MSSISNNRPNLPFTGYHSPVVKPTKQSTQGDNLLTSANPSSEASTPNTNPTKSTQAPTRFEFDPQSPKQPTQGDSPLSAADSTNQLRTIIANSKQAAQKELSPEAEARVAAEGLVSTTFIEPILKQIRESNTAPPPFGPSNAEKQFASLLDTTLADEIVHASNFPIVDRIASQLLKNMPQVQPEKNLDIEG